MYVYICTISAPTTSYMNRGLNKINITYCEVIAWNAYFEKFVIRKKVMLRTCFSLPQLFFSFSLLIMIYHSLGLILLSYVCWGDIIIFPFQLYRNIGATKHDQVSAANEFMFVPAL